MTQPLNHSAEYMSLVAQQLAGYSRRIVVECSFHTLELLVKPDADLGDRFKAWDVETKEFLFVNGWLFTFEDVVVS